MNTLSIRRVSVVLNTASGSVTETTEPTIAALLTELGISDARIWSAEPESLHIAFKAALEHTPDVLIVLGGDGTIRTGAMYAARSHIPLMPLPGGTMNVLPKAIYGVRSWEEVLRDTFAHPTLRPISAGRIENDLFFIAAVVGSPTLWTRVREEMRGGRWRKAYKSALYALRYMFKRKIAYVCAPHMSGSATAVAVVCPLISTELEDEAQTFEAISLTTEDITDVIGLASFAAFGAWRTHAKVSTCSTHVVRIRPQTGKPVPLILDGELTSRKGPFSITYEHQALTVLVPE